MYAIYIQNLIYLAAKLTYLCAVKVENKNGHHRLSFFKHTLEIFKINWAFWDIFKQGIWHSGIFGVQSTIQIHNCFWSAIHLSIQSIFWIVDGSNPDSTPLQLLDWSAEWIEALHFLSSVQISLHSQFKTGHVYEMTKTKFCLGNKQERGMKLPHSA